jgi:hypothetical protein
MTTIHHFYKRQNTLFMFYDRHETFVKELSKLKERFRTKLSDYLDILTQKFKRNFGLELNSFSGRI